MARRVPDGSRLAEVALHKAVACEMSITAASAIPGACRRVADAAREVVARAGDDDRPRLRIRPGKPPPDAAAACWNEIADDYERAAELIEQARELVSDLTRRTRNAELAPLSEQLYADPDAAPEWRADHVFINDVWVAARAKSYSGECLAVWDSDNHQVHWLRPDRNPGLFSPEGIVRDMLQRGALSPMPSDVDLQP